MLLRDKVASSLQVNTVLLMASCQVGAATSQCAVFFLRHVVSFNLRLLCVLYSCTWLFSYSSDTSTCPCFPLLSLQVMFYLALVSLLLVCAIVCAVQMVAVACTECKVILHQHFHPKWGKWHRIKWSHQGQGIASKMLFCTTQPVPSAIIPLYLFND